MGVDCLTRASAGTQASADTLLIMSRGGPVFGDRVPFTITVEDGSVASLIRVSSEVPSERRAGYAGPLGDHAELLDEVRVLGSHRSRMLGASVPVGEVRNWRCLIQCPPGDVEWLREGLER